MRFALLLVLTLAACGADGPPVAPESDVPPGVSVTGTAQVGVANDGG